MCVTVCVCVLCVCVCVCVCVEGRCGGCMGHMYVRCTAPTLLPLCVCVCSQGGGESRGGTADGCTQSGGRAVGTAH